MRDTGLRKGGRRLFSFYQYSYLFRYAHLSLDMEKNWCENGEIVVQNKLDYHVLNHHATSCVGVFVFLTLAGRTQTCQEPPPGGATYEVWHPQSR